MDQGDEGDKKDVVDQGDKADQEDVVDQGTRMIRRTWWIRERE